MHNNIINNNNNNNKIVAATCRHLPGERTLTSSYRWPFLLKQIVMERRKIMAARTTKTDDDKDNLSLSFFHFSRQRQ